MFVYFSLITLKAVKKKKSKTFLNIRGRSEIPCFKVVILKIKYEISFYQHMFQYIEYDYIN